MELVLSGTCILGGPAGGLCAFVVGFMWCVFCMFGGLWCVYSGWGSVVTQEGRACS